MSTKQARSVSEFWSWFRPTTEAIALNPQSSALLAELDVRVRRLNPKLGWEIGPGLSKPWQLVISPSLNRDLRELAESIVAASPALRDWEFHSARQPKKWDFKFELEDSKGRGPLKLDASTWKFLLLKYPDGKNEILLKAERQTKLTTKQRRLAATIVLESILGEETLLDGVDDFQLVEKLEHRLSKMLRPIQRLRDAVRGVSLVTDFIKWIKKSPTNPLRPTG
jgi:hypothetical protein